MTSGTVKLCFDKHVPKLFVLYCTRQGIGISTAGNATKDDIPLIKEEEKKKRTAIWCYSNNAGFIMLKTTLVNVRYQFHNKTNYCCTPSREFLQLLTLISFFTLYRPLFFIWQNLILQYPSTLGCTISFMKEEWSILSALEINPKNKIFNQVSASQKALLHFR